MMKFTEKNDILVKHTSGEYFSRDRELFKVHCPNSRLHTDLKRVNSFNKRKLDGLMLWELLDKVSPEEILKNREEKPAEIIIENIDQAKEILIKMEIDPEKVSEEFLSENVGKPAKDFQSVMEVLKPFLIGENKIWTLSVPPIDNNASDESPLAQELEEKAKELDEKEEELNDKELELDEKDESLEEKAQELEDKEKELSEKEAELEKTSPKKKEANKKSSRK
jgi:hypothetical protein